MCQPVTQCTRGVQLCESGRERGESIRDLRIVLEMGGARHTIEEAEDKTGNLAAAAHNLWDILHVFADPTVQW